VSIDVDSELTLESVCADDVAWPGGGG